MADLTKHDILLNDISQIETQISVLRNNFRDTLQRNKELEGYLIELKNENNELKQRISELEVNEVDTIGSLNLKEKEALKIKLQDLIQRLDYHLSS